MKQIKVSLSDEMRAQLDAAAATAGHSIGEEIRRRVERTLHLDNISPITLVLFKAIETLAELIELQTGHEWHKHPAATRVLQQAIVARLQRRIGADEAVFRRDELPTVRLVAAGSDDPSAMAVALEAIVEFDERRELENIKISRELQAAARKREAEWNAKMQELEEKRRNSPPMTDAEILEHWKTQQRDLGVLKAEIEARQKESEDDDGD